MVLRSFGTKMGGAAVPRWAPASAGGRAVIGAVIWAAFAFTSVPGLHHPAWGHALLTFAALVVLPLWFELTRRGAGDIGQSSRLLRWAARVQLPAAVPLGLAVRQPPGAIATLLAMPWLVVLVMVAVAGVIRLRGFWIRPLASLCGDAALLFAAVGAAWLAVDRAGIRPLGFGADLVLLTAVHFHFAGMILPLVAAHALARLSQRHIAGLLAAGVIGGVPAVAVGITLSQFEHSTVVELGAALVMAGAGMGVGIVHLVLGFQRRWPVGVRILWLAAGCSLIAGMVLATLYGLRSVVTPWPWLTIPWMRALHGSINALGFGLCATVGWWWLARSEPAGTRRR